MYHTYDAMYGMGKECVSDFLILLSINDVNVVYLAGNNIVRVTGHFVNC